MKFVTTPEDEARLTTDAKFVREETHTDVYYDTPDFALTTKDIWLRCRSGRWELKVGKGNSSEEPARQYDEIEDEAGIAEKLKLKASKGPLKERLERAGYGVCITLTTVRKKYEKDGFHIDIDSVIESGQEVIEVEFMAKDESEVPAAMKRVQEFGERYHLRRGLKRGKVAEYLRTQNPKHFEALVASGTIAA